MMFAAALEHASAVAARLDAATAGGDPRTRNLTAAMRDLALGIRRGVDKDAVVALRDFGDVLAYEVDGFGGTNFMDDANVPSLLALPLFNYTQTTLE